MSYEDDVDGYGLEIPPNSNNGENWKIGIHCDIKGKIYEIKEMSDEHLLNTINYFKEYDTRPLIKECIRRKLKIIHKK